MYKTTYMNLVCGKTLLDRSSIPDKEAPTPPPPPIPLPVPDDPAAGEFSDLQRPEAAHLRLLALDVVGEQRHEGGQHGLQAGQEGRRRQPLLRIVLRHRQDRLRPGQIDTHATRQRANTEKRPAQITTEIEGGDM